MKHIKRLTALALALVLLTLSLCTGCTQETAEPTVTTEDAGETDDSVIIIEASQEAKEYENKVFGNGEEKMYLQEEYFDLALASVEGRGEQVLPEVDTENTLTKEIVEGYNVYSLAGENYDNIVLYIHGGAWVYEISFAHVTFCDKLATHLNAKVVMPLYPLAPESTGEETFAFVEDLYKELLKEGKSISIMGDSAGGEITLGLMYAIKEENLTKPEKMVLMAPCADMTFSNEGIEEIDLIDPELGVYGCKKCAEIWAGEENLTHPKYSAVYADVTDYPDTMIIQGTDDILSLDNYILFEHLRQSGVPAKLVKGEGLWHVFAVYDIPERETVLGLITEFCAS